MKERGLLRPRTGLEGFVLSTLVILTSSASKQSYEVGAITIVSPTFQSTAVFKVID